MWPTILIALGFAATTAKTVNSIIKEHQDEKRPKKDKKNTEKGLDDVQA